MKGVKLLIVEDEILIAEDLHDTLRGLGFSEIEMAHDKNTALDRIKSFDPQIILLDIRMEKETDGLEIGEYVTKNSGQPFIYITAHSDVAMVKEIIKTRPAGYITKPVKKSDLFASITLALEKVKQPEAGNKTIAIKDGYATVVIDTNTILYIEAEGNYLNIFCENKKYSSRQSLDSLIEELNDPSFYKIHRSYLVNTGKITKYSKKEVLIHNQKLPVARSISADFDQHMLSRLS
jgi:two-component system, LytTR family, response regulator LytT